MNNIEERIAASPEIEAGIAGGFRQPDDDLNQTSPLLAETSQENSVEAEEVSPLSLMEQLLNDPASSIRTFQYGQVLEGLVMYKDRDELLVDVGAKSEGIVPSRELQSLSAEDLQNIRIGDSLLVFVVQPQNEEGQAVLSVDKARQEKSWRVLQVKHEAGEIVEAQVTGYNKGGLLANLDGVSGFVPSSQVSGLNTFPEAAKQGEMARLVNSTMPFKIIEIDRTRNRLILSERQASQVQRDAQKERLMNELETGQTRDGIVTTVTDFGAFVDIGGADGLVHLSEISWNRVAHPKEVLKSGDRIKVYVLSIDPERRKIALSLKRTQPEPWTQAALTYQPGQIVQATVTQVAAFGAFARVADGIEGLIHVSELSEERVEKPSDIVKEGDILTVRVLNVDPQRKRMSLSLKRAAESYNEVEQEQPEREQEPVEA